MECVECNETLGDFLESRYELGRLNSPLCFSCYLCSNHTAYDYEEYSPGQRLSDYEDIVREALSQKNQYRIDLQLEDYPNDGIVLFAISQSDAESLSDHITGTKLGRYLCETNISHLTELYSGNTQQLYWNVANWRSNPHHARPHRAQTSISIVAGKPCVVESRRFLSDEAQNSIFDELLEDFLDEVGVDQLETLRDVSAAAERWSPILSDLNLRFSTHVQNYFRRNPDHLSTNFVELDEDGRRISSACSTSLEELEEVYEEGVGDFDTVEEEILTLLELVEGAKSKDIAEVVNCSVSYARRFTYDTDSGQAMEKEWSRDAQKQKVSPGTRNRILKRDGSCLRCNDDDDLTIHHIIPISADGETRDNNLATLCKSCHKEAHGGSYYPPTTIYDDLEQFDDWLERYSGKQSGQTTLTSFSDSG